jgi:thiol-disulfide isomerase/thioredoxin
VPSLVLGAVVVVAALVLILRSDVGSPPVVRGGVAPAFSLPTLDRDTGAPGDERSLDSLAGRVVLVNFWATWCEPCEREMPAMERLYRALPHDEFELLAVAIDEDVDDVDEFLSRYELSFPILLDLDQTVYAEYQTMGVPESLLVDRQGRIVERYVGPREWDAPEYVARIQALVDPASASRPPDRG